MELEELEIRQLTQAVYEAYGYDFRQYAEASFNRRIRLFKEKLELPSISHVTAELLHNPSILEQFIQTISVTTSEMFRDPQLFQTIRAEVIPYLKSFPHIRIWLAACAQGEEVLSLSILFKEEGLYDRCSIYATDMNSQALDHSKQAIYPLKHLKEYSRNYQKSGGKGSLSDYYHARYNHVKFDPTLLEKVTFSKHNLATDSVFLETHLIVCRNAMIYFNQDLQNRVLSLFNESLINGGILWLGSRETIEYSPIKSQYTQMDKDTRIYRKKLHV